jgi:hypothetical protein
MACGPTNRAVSHAEAFGGSDRGPQQRDARAGRGGLDPGPAPDDRAHPRHHQTPPPTGNTAAADVELSPADLEEITAADNRVDITGDRYPAHMQRWINC